jgi:hypothetical protein
MANAISLTIRSINNRNCASYIGSFIVEDIVGGSIRDNQNEASAVTITPGTAGATSAWGVYGSIRENQVMYWTLETVTGTTRRVRIYSNSSKTNLIAEGTAVIALNAAGTIFFTQKRESGISGQVTVTIGGSLTDQGNTLTFTNVTVETNLQLNGGGEFVARTGKENLVKFTCTEDAAAIQAKIDAIQS